MPGRPQPALPVALATAASLLGDTLLYTALPVSASQLGLGPLAVGLALSLNRWVRLVTNPIAAWLFEHFPAGLLVFAALVLAAGTTALYAIPAALALFFAARLAWGFCWSILRLGSSLAALDEVAHGAGRRLGAMRATFGLGYVAGAAYAPFAVETFGWAGAAVAAAVLTLALGLWPVFVAVPWRRAPASIEDAPRLSAWDRRLTPLFVVAAIQYGLYSGLLPVVGGLRIAERFGRGGDLLLWLVPATFLAGAFALSQRFAQVVWTYAAGRAADRSVPVTFLASTVLAIAGIGVLALPVEVIPFLAGGALAFFTGITGTIAIELAVARRCTDADRPRILAAYNTWADLGAASGALGGGALALAGTASALGIGAAFAAATVPLWAVAARPRLVAFAR